MSYSVDSSPSVFSSFTPASLTAREEIFTFINHSQKKAIIFDFERRRVNSRCIVRVIDYRTKTVSEHRSRTLRFKIKSTFAPKPYTDEGITFTGGGFTASAVTKNNTTRIIAALPEGIESFKAQLSFTLDPGKASFNQLYKKGRFTEAIHSSLAPSASGTLIIGERKITVNPSEYTVQRVWKTTTFPIKRDYYSSFSAGRTDKPFSFTLSVEEKKCISLIGDNLSIYDRIEMKKLNEEEYIFSDGRLVEINFSNFATIKEKTSPFRQNRTLKYGLFSGHISSFAFSDSFGCIEL